MAFAEFDLSLIRVRQRKGYSVDDNTFEYLDRLERHPEWYCREKVEVAMDSADEILVAWLYFNPTPNGEIIESGIFVYHKSKRSCYGFSLR